MEELPLLEDFRSKSAGLSNLEFLSVSLDSPDTKSELANKVSEGLAWPVVYDGGGWKSAVSTLFEVNSIPQVMLIGPDGKVLLANVWSDSYSDITKVVKAGGAYVPTAINITGIDKTGSGYKVRIDVVNPEATKYDVKVSTWVYTKNADGTVKRPDKPVEKVIKADKSSFSTAFEAAAGKNAVGLRIEVAVFCNFLGHDITGEFSTRL